ncbi:MAG: type II toxin-antitoxin system Phd/YefM family antitoxin [Solirubrobacteraceae bacterium]
MSASEASRAFSALLDIAEHGETVVITRSGRRVAQVSPALQANGGAFKRVVARWAGPVDERLEANIEAAREAASGALDADPWRD